MAFFLKIVSIIGVRTTITNSGKDQKTDGDDCNSKEYVSVHCSLCEIVVQLIVPSELYRFKRGDTENLSNHGAFNILETTLEIIKNVQKFMTSLSTFKLLDCVLNVHDVWSFVRVRSNQKVSELFSNKTLNFTRFNVIQNLQQFVTISSELIQNLNEELFAGHDVKNGVGGLSVFEAHLILYSQMANQPSISSGLYSVTSSISCSSE